MAGKNAYPVKAVSSPKTLYLGFDFAPNFTSDVETIRPGPHITSIVRAAAGTWTVQLDAPYYHLQGQAMRVGADAAGSFRWAHISDVVRGYKGNSVLSLVHEISGTATDIVAADTNAVCVTLFAHDSSEGL